jgi:maleylpyruvate isomerase
MNYVVTTISGSPRGWRVLLGLTFKDIAHEVKYLQLSKAEHKSAAFLAINPRGKVPVLEANGSVIHDSIAILAWLDRAHPDTPLFGSNADEARDIWQLTLETSEYLHAAFHGVFYPVMIQGVSVGSSDGKTFDHLMQAADTLHHECGRLENLLADRDFLAAPTPTAADVVAFPELQLVKRALLTKTEDMTALGFAGFKASYPRVSAWTERILALPGAINTLPPHWNQDS